MFRFIFAIRTISEHKAKIKRHDTLTPGPAVLRAGNSVAWRLLPRGIVPSSRNEQAAKRRSTQTGNARMVLSS
jgi:hypothetical protein